MTDSAKPILLCPLEFELQRLASANLDKSCELICPGPGSESIMDWSRENKVGDRRIVLAGLAGAMSPEFIAGSAHVVTQVVDENGEYDWTPTLVSEDTNLLGEIIVTSTNAPLTGRIARKIMNRESGGMLIDLESVAFASAAQKFGWLHWGIVRGISDDFTSLLPKGLDEWIDESGQTRWGAVMRSLLLKPMLIPKVVELRQNSTMAMSEVVKKLNTLLDLETS